jgi:YD repeat-containing protein
LQEVIDLSPGTYTITFSFIKHEAYPDEGFYGRANYSGSATNSRSNLTATNTPTDYIYPLSVDVKKRENLYETRLNYHSYDIKGNILDVSKEKDIRTSYYWGYNNTYPIAKIDNITYDELSAVSGLTEELDKLDDIDVDLSTINTTIRDLLPNQMVNTYTYKPLIGIATQTDPNGKTIRYDYDNFGRLQTIKDHNGYILNNYNYNYYNSTGGNNPPAPLSATITDEPAGCYQTSLTVAASGGSGNYTYEWSTTDNNAGIANSLGDNCVYYLINDGSLSGSYGAYVTCRVCDQADPTNCTNFNHIFQISCD